MIDGLIRLAAAGADNLDLSVFAQYGVLGVFAAMLVWFAKGAHQRERDRADRLEEENKRLNSLIVDRVIPTLTDATAAAKEAGKLMNAMQRERDVTREASRQQRGGREGAAPYGP